MAKSTKAEAQKTRRRILKAAFVLFAHNGYRQTSFQAVAERVHLTKGAVFWHFKSKPDLFAAIMAGLIAEYRRCIQDAFPFPASLQEITPFFVEQTRRIIRNHNLCRGLRMMQNGNWPPRPSTVIRQTLSELRNDLFSPLEDMLDQAKKRHELNADIDTHLVTEVLHALWLGVSELHLSNRLSCDPLKVIETGFSAIFNTLSHTPRADFSADSAWAFSGEKFTD